MLGLRCRHDALHTQDALVDQNTRDQPNDEDRYERTDGLGAAHAERVLGGRGAARHAERKNRYAKGGDVGEEVRGIRHDRERAGEIAANHLGRGEEHADDQRAREAREGFARARVEVAAVPAAAAAAGGGR